MRQHTSRAFHVCLGVSDDEMMNPTEPTLMIGDTTKTQSRKARQHGGRGARQGEEASEKGTKGYSLQAGGEHAFHEGTTHAPHHTNTTQQPTQKLDTTEQRRRGGDRGRVSPQKFTNGTPGSQSGRRAVLQDDRQHTWDVQANGRPLHKQFRKLTLRQKGLGLRRRVRLAGSRDGDARRGRGSGGRGPGTVLIAGHLLSVVRRVLPELLWVAQPRRMELEGWGEES